jgi:hypothetical protein
MEFRRRRARGGPGDRIWNEQSPHLFLTLPWRGPQDLADAKVLSTYFEGTLVFERS